MVKTVKMVELFEIRELNKVKKEAEKLAERMILDILCGVEDENNKKDIAYQRLRESIRKILYNESLEF